MNCPSSRTSSKVAPTPPAAEQSHISEANKECLANNQLTKSEDAQKSIANLKSAQNLGVQLEEGEQNDVTKNSSPEKGAKNHGEEKENPTEKAEKASTYLNPVENPSDKADAHFNLLEKEDDENDSQEAAGTTTTLFERRCNNASNNCCFHPLPPIQAQEAWQQQPDYYYYENGGLLPDDYCSSNEYDLEEEWAAQQQAGGGGGGEGGGGGFGASASNDYLLDEVFFCWV
jgi:hypothetical protein